MGLGDRAESRSRRRRVWWALLLGVAVIDALAAGAVAVLVLQARRRVLEATAVTTQNLARLLDVALTGFLDELDMRLLVVKDEIDRQGAEGRVDEAALRAVLARQKDRAPDVLAFRLVDREGFHRLSAPPSDERVSLADRDYFLAARDGAAFTVSQPYLGRLTQRTTLALARRLEAPDGTFAGLVMCAIDLQHLAAMMARIDVGPQGVIALRAEDLRLVARVGAGGPEGLIESPRVSASFRERMSSGQTSGTFEAGGPFDQVRRVLAFRRLDHYPFYVIVGLAEEEQLAGWRRQAGIAFAALAAFVLITFSGLAVALRAWRRQQSAEERLAATLASIGEGVVATDLDGRVLFLNGVAERLTGWRGEEAGGRPVEEVVRLLDRRTRAPRPSAVTPALGRREDVEPPDRVLLVDRGGRERTVTEIGSPIRDAAGALVGAVLVLHNVTAQEKAEDELARVQKLDSLAVLAGGIAHDFNNLLTGITGNISLAREDPAAEQAGEALADAEAAALRARGLTHQLLTFSRGGSPVKRRIDLSAAVEEAARFAARGTGTALRIEAAPGLCVEADAGQLAQVVQNLVLNGIQVMGSGGTLAIRTERGIEAGRAGAPDRPVAIVSVTDTGPGIAPEILPRIFDPFFTTRPQGKGLGLAICHSIVTKHGGAIEVASPPEGGATFRVTLPALAQPAAARAAPGEAAPRPAAACGRILVMDDEEAVLRLAERTLAPLGYEVVRARHGDEAVARYREAREHGQPFAAVVMDLTIPGGMGGREALASIRALDPGVVAIVSSGYSHDPVMADWAAHGFRGALRKPYVAEELRCAVARALAGETEPAASAAPVG